MSDDIEEGEIIEDNEICDITNVSHIDDDVILDFERVKHIPSTNKYYFPRGRYGKYENKNNYSSDSYDRVELKESGIGKRKASSNVQGSLHKSDSVQSKSEVKSSTDSKKRTLSPLSCTSSCSSNCSHSTCLSCSDCGSPCSEILMGEGEKDGDFLFDRDKSGDLICDYQIKANSRFSHSKYRSNKCDGVNYKECSKNLKRKERQFSSPYKRHRASLKLESSTSKTSSSQSFRRKSLKRKAKKRDTLKVSEKKKYKDSIVSNKKTKKEDIRQPVSTNYSEILEVDLDDSLKSKVIPGSLGEMLVKRAIRKLNEYEPRLYDAKVVLDAKSASENDIAVDNEIVGGSFKSREHEDEIELTLRYEALQSAVKSCESNYVIKSNILKILRESKEIAPEDVENIIRRLDRNFDDKENSNTLNLQRRSNAKSGNADSDMEISDGVSNEFDDHSNTRSLSNTHVDTKENSLQNLILPSSVDNSDKHMDLLNDRNNISSLHHFSPSSIKSDSHFQSLNPVLEHKNVVSLLDFDKLKFPPPSLEPDQKPCTIYPFNPSIPPPSLLPVPINHSIKTSSMEYSGDKVEQLPCTIPIVTPISCDSSNYECNSSSNVNTQINPACSEKSEEVSIVVKASDNLLQKSSLVSTEISLQTYCDTEGSLKLSTCEEGEDEDILRAELLKQMAMKFNSNDKSNPTTLPSQGSVKVLGPLNINRNTVKGTLKPLGKLSGSCNSYVKGRNYVINDKSRNNKSSYLDISVPYLDNKNRYLVDNPLLEEFCMSKFPPVKPVIIPLGEDSDEESDTDISCQSKGLPVAHKCESLMTNIDSLLKSVRNSCSALPSTSVLTTTNSKIKNDVGNVPLILENTIDVPENKITQIKTESTTSCSVSRLCSNISVQDQLNIGLSSHFTSSDISHVSCTSVSSLSKNCLKEEVIEEEIKNAGFPSENLSDGGNLLQDDLSVKELLTKENTFPQHNPEHVGKLLDTENNQSVIGDVTSFPFISSSESSNYLGSSDSSSSDDSSSSSDESEGSISKEEELLRNKLLKKRQNLLESGEAHTGSRSSTPVSIEMNKLEQSITKDYVDEILSSLVPSFVGQSNIPLNIEDNDITANCLPSVSASVTNETVLSEESPSSAPRNITEYIPQDKDSESLTSKHNPPEILVPIPSPSEKDVSIDVNDENNRSNVAQNIDSVSVSNENANSLKQDLTKDIENEFIIRNLSRRKILSEVSSLLDESKLGEMECEKLFSQISKHFSVIDDLRKQKEAKSVKIACNIEKLLSLLEKLDEDARTLSKLEELTKQVTSKDKDSLASFMQKSRKDEELRKCFLRQTLLLKDFLKTHSKQNYIICKAVGKRRNDSFDSKKFFSNNRKKFKLDNRILDSAVPNRSKVTSVQSNFASKKTLPSYSNDKISCTKSSTNTKKNKRSSVDDFGVLCPFDLLGRCNDSSCVYQHTSSHSQVSSNNNNNIDSKGKSLKMPEQHSSLLTTSLDEEKKMSSCVQSAPTILPKSSQILQIPSTESEFCSKTKKDKNISFDSGVDNTTPISSTTTTAVHSVYSSKGHHSSTLVDFPQKNKDGSCSISSTKKITKSTKRGTAKLVPGNSSRVLPTNVDSRNNAFASTHQNEIVMSSRKTNICKLEAPISLESCSKFISNKQLNVAGTAISLSSNQTIPTISSSSTNTCSLKSETKNELQRDNIQQQPMAGEKPERTESYILRKRRRNKMRKKKRKGLLHFPNGAASFASPHPLPTFRPARRPDYLSWGVPLTPFANRYAGPTQPSQGSANGRGRIQRSGGCFLKTVVPNEKAK